MEKAMLTGALAVFHPSGAVPEINGHLMRGADLNAESQKWGKKITPENS